MRHVDFDPPGLQETRSPGGCSGQPGRRLFAGGSLGEAAIAGREAARGLGDATWLAYTVYGHPEARFEPQ